VQQVGDFLWALLASATDKTDRHDITVNLLKVALKHNKPKTYYNIGQKHRPVTSAFN